MTVQTAFTTAGLRWAAMAMALMLAGAARAETLTGRASVIDGNTLEIEGRPLRLKGIDAPDLEQLCQDRQNADYACGRHARDALATRLRDESITCETTAQDEAGRLLAVCRGAGGDLNAWMVRAGHAVAVRGADAPYADEDRKAWARRTGLWSGVFEEPAAWRERHQRTAEALRESRNRQIAKAQ